ncbi:MAG: ABC transporter ATP-binding protein [Planctomycetota bacterium]|nr:ABC transporter ATP-binding protein [Planctomycetota bacterium]
MLIADSIQKRYPTRGDDLVILRSVSLKMAPGDSIAVMGPSGCGKSTLLNILGTLDQPSGGSLTIDESDPFSMSEPELARFRNRRIGFVFQDHHLMPQCSALENVLLPTLVSDDGGDGLGRARDLLDAVGLAERVDHMPAELSGGERQRVAVARALINRPAVVLADEPTGNLDRTTGESVGALLAGLPGRQDVILIVVTHSERLARRFDRIFDLADGALNSR